MTYAHRKDIYDADTHMMEHPNWIYDFASEDIKEHLEPIVEGCLLYTSDAADDTP